MSERLIEGQVAHLSPKELMDALRDLEGTGQLGALPPDVVQAVNRRWWQVASALNPDSDIYAPNIQLLRDGNWKGAMVPRDFEYMTDAPQFSHGDVLWLGAGIGVDGAIPWAGWKLANGKGRVVAADVSHEAMERAATLVRELDGSNVSLFAVAAGIYNLPLPEGRFHAVAMTGGVLQYLPSLDEVARQVYRVLIKGGVLYWRDNGPVVPGEPITLVDRPPIIGTGYYGLSRVHEEDAEARRLLESLRQLPVIRFRYSPTTIQDALRGAGFDDVSIETQDFLGYQREGMVLDPTEGVYRYPSGSPYARKPLSFIMTAGK